MIRVAFYARVSTEHEEQVDALQNQLQYYYDFIEAHKNEGWVLVKYYVDKGITGTSAKKRENFMEMIEDGQRDVYDLLITREVSRFARNTLDSIKYTRDLRKWGRVVYFTMDNIKTSDPDCEFKLTIMASLAQEESRKLSERVKAGQKVSMERGVLYGSGNILGYDRVGDTYVINEEQAETVRLIFNAYAEGLGIRKIQYLLEEKKMKTSMGCTRWDLSAISRIIRNSTYCAKLEYRKYFVPDFLEQKAQKNMGQLPKIYRDGTFPPIIEEELFIKCTKIRKSKKQSQINENTPKERGVKISPDLFVRKLVCSCGSAFNKQKWRVRKDGSQSFGYQCYKNKNYGKRVARQEFGVSEEVASKGCDEKMIVEWKLKIMSCVVINMVIANRQKIIDRVTGAVKQNIVRDRDCSSEIAKLEKKVERYRQKINVLIELRTENEINKDEFVATKEEFTQKILQCNAEINEYRKLKEFDKEEDKVAMVKRILEQELGEGIEDGNFNPNVLEDVVEKIEVKNGEYKWFLFNLKSSVNMAIEGRISSKSNPPTVSVQCPSFVGSSTSSN